EDDDERALLADAMGSASAAQFERTLAGHRRHVEGQFALVFGDSDVDAITDDGRDAFVTIWDDPGADEDANAKLAAAGCSDPARGLSTLVRMRESGRYAQLPSLPRQRFDVLVPRLLAVAAGERMPGIDPDTVLMRLLALLETVARRSAYLALVVEHPPLLPRLV